MRQYEGQIDSQVEGQVHEGMLGHVHPLAEDEDLHFALESPALQTPIVCELMNALSIPPDQPATYWGDQFAQLFSTGQTVRVQGVFRLWPDHAASTEETDRATSNPPHVTEIHPITAVQGGDTVLDTVKNVAPITYQGEQYAYKAPDRWGDMLSHDIQARVVRKGDTDYLELDTPQIGFNYWELKVRLVEPVTSAPGGHRFSVRIETPTRVYQEIVPCFTIEGSEADRAAAALHPDDEPVVAAIGRFDLKKLLGGYRGPPPVELCVFGINPPRLPAAGRSPARRESAGPADRSESSRRRGSESDRVAGEYQPTPEPVGAGRYADTAANGAVIGNRNSHVYHAADSPHLPAPANRVYFQSAAEAEAAGYRRSRSD